ncbi:MAG: nucleotide exchange factor GrpE [Pararhizobium sp.]
MTDETKKYAEAESAEEAARAAGSGEAPSGPAAAAGDTDPLEALRSENSELRDRFLRTVAEMENLRRRTERDVKDARSYSIAGFARDMLAVSDNLARALDAVPAETRANADEGLKALLEGVEMTERSMLAALERHGVRKIEPEGQKFDPNFHQAMFEVPNADVPNNTVVQVVQAGYVIGERVLRPAMVGVAKGGPKPVAAEAQSAEPGAPNAQAERDA